MTQGVRHVTRRTIALIFAIGAVLAPPVHAGSTVSAVSGVPFDPAPLGGRCGDPAGSWLGMRWSSTYEWRFNPESIPTYLVEQSSATPGATALSATLAAADAVATGRNDCDLPEFRTLTQNNLGLTTRAAAVTGEGGCGTRDNHNVISFGTLPPGLLAVTCVWWEGPEIDQRSVEADVLLDATGGSFFLSPPEDCSGQWDLQSIVTHEFGHIFGLGHVAYAQHSALTMSEGLPECTTGYRSLGLGDYLTLKTHYPG